MDGFNLRTDAGVPGARPTRPALVVHGGAGLADPAIRDAQRAGAGAALAAGWQVLHAGGSALDAVCVAVRILEDCPVFNAGTGSCLTADGRVEMDASVAEGTTLRAGAVALVTRTRHPVAIARGLLDRGGTVFLAGAAADAWAQAHGLAPCTQEDLITARQRELWARGRAGLNTGTVGAVAVDGRGRTAAATSTGGIMGKPSGRIGDSPVIGAGTCADDGLGAASATGEGEAILRLGLGRHALGLLADGRDPAVAAPAAIAALERRTGGRGGLILVDPLGRIGAACNAPAMAWGWMRADRDAPAIGF